MSETLVALDQRSEYPDDPIGQARQAALEQGAYREGYPSGEASLDSDPGLAQAYVDEHLSTRFPGIYPTIVDKKEK